MTTVTITDIGSDEVTIPVSDTSDIIVQTLSDGPPLGNYVADHSLAVNLESDDHPQYLNVPRGDARYASKSHEQNTTIHFTLDDVVVEASDVIGLDQPNILYVANIGDPENTGINLVQPYSNTLYNTTASFTTEYKNQLDNINTLNLLYTSDIGSTVQGYSAVLNNTTASFNTALETKLNGIEALAEVNNISNGNAGLLTNNTDTSLHFHNSDRDRANHTGTQNLSTIVNSSIINEPTSNTRLDQLFNLQESAGITSSVNVSYVTNGEVAISGCEFLIRASDDGSGQLISCSIEPNSIVVSNNITSYIYIDYNSGDPVYTSTTTPTIINVSNKLPIAIISRKNDLVYLFNVGNDSIDCLAKFRKRSFYSEKFIKAQGGIISNPSGLDINISSGNYWFGLSELNLVELEILDFFSYHYFNGTSWIEVANVNQIDYLNYNNINSGLSNTPNKGYVNHWIYAAFGNVSKPYHVVYGQSYFTNLSDAIGESAPLFIPDHLNHLSILLGVVTTRQDSLNLVSTRTIQSNIGSLEIPTHNNLSGLNIADYQHLTEAEKLLFDTLHTSNPPATSTSPGIAGTITWDASDIYVCVATDTWVKSPLTTW